MWQDIPERAVPQSRPRAWFTTVRLLPAAAIAALFAWLGRPWLAVAVLTVAAAIVVISLVSPAFDAGFDRVVRAVGRYAGQGLSIVLFAALHVLVLAPVSLGLRAFGWDPLALRRDVERPSLWIPRPEASDKLARRQFAAEISAPRIHRTVFASVIAGLRNVTFVLLVAMLANYGAGRMWTALAASGDSPDPRAQREAMNADWAEAYFDELDRAGLRWNPLIGFMREDQAGEHINITDGLRQSYQPSLGGREPIEVFFFGGSTMWGTGQRDVHTIPSEFARLAEADGIPVRVVNYGQPGWVIWQEAIMLTRELTKHPPDIAVFYDGVNEVNAQFADLSDEPTYPRAAQVRPLIRETTTRGLLADLWADYELHSFVHRLARRIRSPRAEIATPLAAGELKSIEENARSVYARGVDLLAGIEAGMDVDVELFWQPAVLTKPQGEEEMVGALAVRDLLRAEAHRELSASLPEGVVDLSGVFDDERSPVFFDWAHTNELGARLIAAAMYERLEPRLRELGSMDS